MLIIGLAQLLFEIVSEPSMSSVTAALERLSHQSPESQDVWILEEARGRYTWLAMALLSLVALSMARSQDAKLSGRVISETVFLSSFHSEQDCLGQKYSALCIKFNPKQPCND